MKFRQGSRVIKFYLPLSCSMLLACVVILWDRPQADTSSAEVWRLEQTRNRPSKVYRTQGSESSSNWPKIVTLTCLLSFYLFSWFTSKKQNKILAMQTSSRLSASFTMDRITERKIGTKDPKWRLIFLAVSGEEFWRDLKVLKNFRMDFKVLKNGQYLNILLYYYLCLCK